MTRLMLSGAAALGLLAAPALAQEAATGDQQPMDTAIQSAEGVGIQNVGGVDGAFVLQGTSSQGTPILMVVGPAGELLAIATPLAAPMGQVTGAEQTSAETGAEPAAGEPADSGFMATQAQPASPNAWDPAMVEGAMRGLGGGADAATGEAPSE